MLRLSASAFALAIGLLPMAAEAASCRGYGEEARAAIKHRIEALQLLEREAADRLAGLDSRTYDYLAEQARFVTEAIANPLLLSLEDDLHRCRNYVPPVRQTCAAAARQLVILLTELVNGAATKDSKQSYKDGMSRCEKWMGLKPLDTALRAVD